MTTRTLTAAVATAAATTAVLAGVAGGQAAPTTITAVQTDRFFRFEDVAPKGGPGKPFTQGDAFVIGGTLATGGKAVGRSHLVCTTTRPGRAGGSLCTGALVLAGGEVIFSGYNTVSDVPRTDFAVTGGTGDYAGATGVVATREAPHDRTAITVTLR